MRLNSPAAATRSLAAHTAVLVLMSVGCGQTASREGLAGGETLYSNNCAVCHGDAGEGKTNISAPPVAGLAQWYVVAQLEKFREGVRGAHFDDPEGLRMRPMSKTLRDETEVQAVSTYVASLPAAPGEHTVEGGDASNGATLYKTCAACHGLKGEGNQALRAPSLTPAGDWYALKQLQKFRSGVRGQHPKDVGGQQMGPMALTLADEQALKDVVTHIRTLGR
jgi:cytochrome c553